MVAGITIFCGRISDLRGTDCAIVVSEILQGSEPLGGHFILEFDGARTGQLLWSSSAIQIQHALEGLSTIGLLSVERSTHSTGIAWSVTFLTQGGDLSDITSDGAPLQGSGASVLVSETLTGRPNFNPDSSITALVIDDGDTAGVTRGQLINS